MSQESTPLLKGAAPFEASSSTPVTPVTPVSKTVPTSTNITKKTVPTIPNSRIGPQRTSKTTQKLRLLPEEPSLDDNDESGREVYSQVTQIKDTLARKDAEQLGKSQRESLPRVTAYCTASSYKMKDLIKWLNDRKKQNQTWPKLIDECLYTPFEFRIKYNNVNNEVIKKLDNEGGDLELSQIRKDAFIFNYGVVVLWGFNKDEEIKFLEYLSRFENEKLSDEDIQIEEFNYYITKSYQPRIYNDFITLKDGKNYMIKLSISHAIAQSNKISLFEELVDNTIEDTQNIPQQISKIGKVLMTRNDIMKSIGELFILRININLHGSILDSPELMWSEPYLEPIYQATRGYLEINQRVELLNQRVEVISDLLQMLKNQLGHSHEEYLEVVVIVLIAVEVIVSIVNVIIGFAIKK